MNNDMLALVTFRLYKDSDEAYVMATWLRGLYYGNEFFKLIPKGIFMDNYKLALTQLVKNSVVMVAVLQEDPDIILGYSVMNNQLDVCHWVNVKLAWRYKGLGRALLPKSVSKISHFTTLGLKLMPKIDNCVFDPFALT